MTKNTVTSNATNSRNSKKKSITNKFFIKILEKQKVKKKSIPSQYVEEIQGKIHSTGKNRREWKRSTLEKGPQAGMLKRILGGKVLDQHMGVTENKRYTAIFAFRF